MTSLTTLFHLIQLLLTSDVRCCFLSNIQYPDIVKLPIPDTDIS